MKLLIHNIKYRLQIFLHKFGWQITRWHPLKQETDVIAIQKRIVSKEEPVIFDVGSWIGKTARKYVEQFGAPVVHCFEPFPSSYNKLVESTQDIKSCLTYVNKAISNESGIQRFSSNKIETTNSLLESKDTGSAQDFFRDTVDELKVPTITIDAYCKENDIHRIDILKMDTQGGELKGLQGAVDLLSDQRITTIFCEVSFVAMYADSPLYHDIAAFLQGYGYSLHGLHGLVKNEEGQLMWGDALFVKDGYSEK